MDNTFGIPIIPDNEDERLNDLHGLKHFETYQEEGPFKHIASMAARMFNVPIALVNFVDNAHVFTKSGVGLSSYNPVPRGTSLCSLAILKSGVTVFENALNEPCLLSNPMVTDEFGLRFYAAAPLVSNKGHHVGALCLVDKSPRTFSELDQKILANLASILMEEVEKDRT